MLNSQTDLDSFITVITLLNYSWAPSALFLVRRALIRKVAALVCQTHAAGTKKQVGARHGLSLSLFSSNDITLNSEETVTVEMLHCCCMHHFIASSCRPHVRCAPGPCLLQKFDSGLLQLRTSRPSPRRRVSVQITAVQTPAGRTGSRWLRNRQSSSRSETSRQDPPQISEFVSSVSENTEQRPVRGAPVPDPYVHSERSLYVPRCSQGMSLLSGKGL